MWHTSGPMHSAEKPFTCDQCPKKFIQKAHLTRHQLVHSGEKPYSCDQCPSKFTQKCDLTRHQQRMHSGEKPFHIDFNVEINLTSDQWDELLNDLSDDDVDIYDDLLLALLANDQHDILDYDEYEELLDLSGDEFLEEPAGSASDCGEKSYSCEQCPTKFNQEYALTRHNLFLHTEVPNTEEPYSCDQCLEKFTQKGHLRDHKRLHTTVNKIKFAKIYTSANPR